MSLWGKTDTNADVPTFVSAADANNVFFVDTTEAGVASNRAKGIKSPGWYRYVEHTDANSVTRRTVELLVPMKVAAGDAGDVGAVVISANAMTIGYGYTIATAGTSDFTLYGSANSDVGTAFTATAIGTGNGTVAATADILAANGTVDTTEYQIVTAGDSDFTAVGASNNDVGTVFTANGAASGTGTVVETADIVTGSSISDTASINYTILTAGTSDFTLIGAANNDVGTTFDSVVVGTGTGTVTQDDDQTVADS